MTANKYVRNNWSVYLPADLTSWVREQNESGDKIKLSRLLRSAVQAEKDRRDLELRMQLTSPFPLQ